MTEIGHWSVSQVGTWLAFNGFQPFVEPFAQQEVDGTLFVQLDDDMLAELGMSSKLQRRKFLIKLKQAVDENLMCSVDDATAAFSLQEQQQNLMHQQNLQENHHPPLGGEDYTSSFSPAHPFSENASHVSSNSSDPSNTIPPGPSSPPAPRRALPSIPSSNNRDNNGSQDSNRNNTRRQPPPLQVLDNRNEGLYMEVGDIAGESNVDEWDTIRDALHEEDVAEVEEQENQDLDENEPLTAEQEYERKLELLYSTFRDLGKELIDDSLEANTGDIDQTVDMLVALRVAVASDQGVPIGVQDPFVIKRNIHLRRDSGPPPYSLSPHGAPEESPPPSYRPQTTQTTHSSGSHGHLAPTRGGPPLSAQVQQRLDALEVVLSTMSPVDRTAKFMFPHISRDEAELILRNYGFSPGLYLVRPSTTLENAFVLSVVSEEGAVLHHVIYRNPNHCFDVFGVTFRTLTELVLYLSDRHAEVGWYSPLVRYVPNSFYPQSSSMSSHPPPSNQNVLRSRTTSVHTPSPVHLRQTNAQPPAHTDPHRRMSVHATPVTLPQARHGTFSHPNNRHSVHASSFPTPLLTSPPHHVPINPTYPYPSSPAFPPHGYPPTSTPMLQTTHHHVAAPPSFPSFAHNPATPAHVGALRAGGGGGPYRGADPLPPDFVLQAMGDKAKLDKYVGDKSFRVEIDDVPEIKALGFKPGMGSYTCFLRTLEDCIELAYTQSGPKQASIRYTDIESIDVEMTSDMVRMIFVNEYAGVFYFKYDKPLELMQIVKANKERYELKASLSLSKLPEGSEQLANPKLQSKFGVKYKDGVVEEVPKTTKQSKGMLHKLSKTFSKKGSKSKGKPLPSTSSTNSQDTSQPSLGTNALPLHEEEESEGDEHGVDTRRHDEPPALPARNYHHNVMSHQNPDLAPHVDAAGTPHVLAGGYVNVSVSSPRGPVPPVSPHPLPPPPPFEHHGNPFEDHVSHTSAPPPLPPNHPSFSQVNLSPTNSSPNTSRNSFDFYVPEGSDSSQPTRIYMRALVDNNDAEEGVLTYKKGDIILVTQRNESSLWEGVVNGKSGKFYVAEAEYIGGEYMEQIKLRDIAFLEPPPSYAEEEEEEEAI